MKSIKGTKTEKNLLASFAGESQARNRYTFFASQAKKDGFIQIQKIFEETAANEMEHAKRYFKFLEGGAVEIQATYPAGRIGTTSENLKASAEGENEEHTKLYPEAARIADEAGLIASVEKHHEERYRGLLKNIEEGKVFKKDKPLKWKCNNCGYIFEGSVAPDKCPTCLHPQSYFEVLCDNF